MMFSRNHSPSMASSICLSFEMSSSDCIRYLLAHHIPCQTASFLNETLAMLRSACCTASVEEPFVKRSVIGWLSTTPSTTAPFKCPARSACEKPSLNTIASLSVEERSIWSGSRPTKNLSMNFTVPFFSTFHNVIATPVLTCISPNQQSW